MKDPPGSTDPFAPPLKIVRAHCAPAIERNAPVLSPFLCKWVVFENWLGGRAAKPIQHEFIGARETVGAVIADTEGDVAHQRHAALLRVRFNIPPLLMSNPLHVTKEISALCKACLPVMREIAYPVASTFNALMVRRPSIPCGATIVFLDENAEKRVIVQPGRLFFTESFEL